MRKISPEKPTATENPDAESESAVFAAELGEAPEIDLHGKTVDAAIHDLENFLHQELMRGSEVIRIIHGRGNQVLRKAIHVWLEKQKRLDLVAYFRDAHNPHEQNAVTYAALHRLGRND